MFANYFQKMEGKSEKSLDYPQNYCFSIILQKKLGNTENIKNANTPFSTKIVTSWEWKFPYFDVFFRLFFTWVGGRSGGEKIDFENLKPTSDQQEHYKNSIQLTSNQNFERGARIKQF